MVLVPSEVKWPILIRVVDPARVDECRMAMIDCRGHGVKSFATVSQGGEKIVSTSRLARTSPGPPLKTVDLHLIQ
jgi:hypothetical protein